MPYPPWPPITFIPYPPRKDGKFRFYRPSLNTELRPNPQPSIRFSPHPEELEAGVEMVESSEEEEEEEEEERTLSPEPQGRRRIDDGREPRSERISERGEGRFPPLVKERQRSRKRSERRIDQASPIAGGGRLEGSGKEKDRQPTKQSDQQQTRRETVQQTPQQPQQRRIAPTLIGTPHSESQSSTRSHQRKTGEEGGSKKRREKQCRSGSGGSDGETKGGTNPQAGSKTVATNRPRRTETEATKQPQALPKLAVPAKAPLDINHSARSNKRTHQADTGCTNLEGQAKKPKTKHIEPTAEQQPKSVKTPGSIRNPSTHATKEERRVQDAASKPAKALVPAFTITSAASPAKALVPAFTITLASSLTPSPTSATPISRSEPITIPIPTIPIPTPLTPPATPTNPAKPTKAVKPTDTAPHDAPAGAMTPRQSHPRRPEKGTPEWKEWLARKRERVKLKMRAKRERRRIAKAAAATISEDQTGETAESAIGSETPATAPPTRTRAGKQAKKHHPAPIPIPSPTSAAPGLLAIKANPPSTSTPTTRTVKTVLLAATKQRKEKEKAKKRKKEKEPKNPKQEKRKKRLESLKVDGQAYCPACLKARCLC